MKLPNMVFLIVMNDLLNYYFSENVIVNFFPSPEQHWVVN